MSPLNTKSQAKKKCQRRPMDRSRWPGSVTDQGKPRSSRSPSASVREAEHAGRVEVVAEDGGDALGGVAILHRFHRHHRIVEGRTSTRIESGMGVEDLQAAHQQDKQHERIDPMGDAHRARMPIDDLSFLHGALATGGARVWMQSSRLRAACPRSPRAAARDRSPICSTCKQTGFWLW